MISTQEISQPIACGEKRIMAQAQYKFHGEKPRTGMMLFRNKNEKWPKG